MIWNCISGVNRFTYNFIRFQLSLWLPVSNTFNGMHSLRFDQGLKTHKSGLTAAIFQYITLFRLKWIIWFFNFEILSHACILLLVEASYDDVCTICNMCNIKCLWFVDKRAKKLSFQHWYVFETFQYVKIITNSLIFPTQAIQRECDIYICVWYNCKHFKPLNIPCNVLNIART